LPAQLPTLVRAYPVFGSVTVPNSTEVDIKAAREFDDDQEKGFSDHLTGG
jgi:hypothetical protein